MSISVGVSTACLYPELTEASLEALCGMGIKLVEIFMNAHCELEKGSVEHMKRILDKNGVKCVSLHPFTCGIEPTMFFTSYERRFSDMLEYHKKYFEAMNGLGAEYFILHGNNPKNHFPDEAYFERFSRLQSLAKTFGVTVTQENVARCTSGNLDFLVKMKKALGSEACFTLDTKQAVRYGADPYDFVKRLGNSIKHVHISDHGDDRDCKLVGTGRLDFPKFLNALRQADFDGSVVLELYRKDFGKPEELFENYEFMKKQL